MPGSGNAPLSSRGCSKRPLTSSRKSTSRPLIQPVSVTSTSWPFLLRVQTFIHSPCGSGSSGLVGETGFEPATPSPPDWCATELRHSPPGWILAEHHHSAAAQAFTFATPGALHEPDGHLHRVLAVEKYRGHRLGDGQLDAKLLPQAKGLARGGGALRPHRHPGLQLLQRLAAGDADSQSPVAAVGGGTGDDQVAHAGEAREGAWPRPHRHP